MDDAVKQLARLPLRDVPSPQRLRRMPTSRRSFHKCPTSGPSWPHTGEGPSRPRATCRHPTRLGWTPTSRRSFQKCRASGPSRPHAGEGPSRPRVTCHHPTRLRRMPTSRRSFQKCRASGPSRPHTGEGPSSISPFQKLRKDSSPGHFDLSGHLPTWMIVSLTQ